MDRAVDSIDPEGHQSSPGRQRGGWITFPFLIASAAGMSLSAGGWMTNLIVYLIQEFNIKNISAAKISNVAVGCTGLFPIAAAIVADSFLGCFSVLWISSLISSLGSLMLVLTAAISKLRPPKCENGSSLCTEPSEVQIAVLYVSLALVALGVAGSRFTIATMGANQFDKPRHQGIFFNWYICTLYASTVLATTVIVYVQGNVSWALGFGICLAANILGLAVFLVGSSFYRHIKPQGSPFVSLSRVIIAAIRKRTMFLSLKNEDYYQGTDDAEKVVIMPTRFLMFLNRAALKNEGDTRPDGSIRKPSELCTVQEVEDLKSLIKILPLWSTSLFVSTPLVIQLSMAVLQALAMDRHFGAHFTIPAGSIQVFIMLSTAIALIFIDRLLYPLWNKFDLQPITPLRRVGIGHLLNILSMAISALVESRRLKIAQQHHLQNQDNAVVPMSVFWLVPPLAVVGVAEAFHFPGNIDFYYQAFPASLKSTSTAFVGLYIGIAYYIGNALIDLARRTTGWLPDNINEGRLDNMYWLCCVLGVLNFSYFLVLAWFYKYQDQDVEKVDAGSAE